MAGTDARRIEHQIRSLPGVVACQFTATNALILVGPDGDAAAIQAAVSELLAAAASELTLNVLAAPRPVAAAVASLARRRRRKAAFAMAGSAAALSASMAAAATVVVLGGVEVPDARPRERTETAAPITLLTEPPVAEQLATPRPRTLTDKLIDAVDTAVAPVAAAPADPAAPGPVLIAVPLPPVLANLEKSTRSVKSAPAAEPPVPTPQPAPELAIASAVPDAGDEPPFGVARRVRKGNAEGPAAQASPIATAEGAKDLPR